MQVVTGPPRLRARADGCFSDGIACSDGNDGNDGMQTMGLGKTAAQNHRSVTRKLMFRLSRLLGLGAVAAFGLAGLVFFTGKNGNVIALPAYNVSLSTVSVSGLSSGGYMAAQLHVAYSKTIQKGAGIIAGGPVYCSQGKLATATGPCMDGAGSRALPRLLSTLSDWAANGRIDPVSHLRDDRLYLFSGTKDTTVRQPVMDDLNAMMGQFIPRANIAYRKDVAAEHGMPTDDFGNRCGDKGSPFLNDCDTDAAGDLLTWIYGRLNGKNTGELTGSFVSFDQKAFWGNRDPASHGMASDGWAYVPANCAAGQSCRLHVVFHGCKQNADAVGDDFYRHAGYNEWADANGIIVLYPQTEATFANPNGCWDWWGYDDPNFAVKAGGQMVAVKTMIDRIVSGEADAPFTCNSWHDSNEAHVRAGRAYANGGNVYAKDSNQYLGFHSAVAYTSVRNTSAGYYAYGKCPQ